MVFMATYQELLKQREALEQQIADARKRETAEAVARVRALIAEHGLTAQDVFPIKAKSSNQKGSKVAAKYKNPATGETWTGRGKPPKWIAGQDRAKYALT
jgi:DNA-binding protein H-NS